MKELAPIPRIRPVARRALSAQSDERLVKLLREGHDAAFDEIVGRYQGPLTAFAAAFIPFHRAEDVVQASLLKAHKALLTDDRDIALRAWLFTIVRNGALNAIRDEPDWQELDPAYDGVPQPPAIAEQNEELQRLVIAICALPEAQRRALVGRELEGEGHADLASELGTTATAVRGLIFRARTTLRDALGALIPLPVVRMLLTQGSAAGATAGAGAGAGLGLGAAGLGGGAKVAASIAAAALVVGGGFALEKKNGGREGGTEVAKAATETSGGGSAASSGRGRVAGPASDTATASETREGDGSGPGDSNGPGGEESRGSAPSGSSGPGSDGSGSGSSGSSGTSGHSSGHEPGDDGSSGPGPGPTPEPGDDDGGHSGSGGGDDLGGDDSSGPGGGEIPEPDDSFDDGGHSGSGGGEDVPEPEDSFDDGGDDHSGPGGGEEPDDD